MKDVEFTAKRIPHLIELDTDLIDRNLDRAHRAIVDNFILEMDTDIVFGPPGTESVSSPPSLWEALTARRLGLTWHHRWDYLRCLIRGHRFEKMVVKGIRRPHMRIWCPACTFEVYRKNAS